MPNQYFSFKQFTVYHGRCAFKVGTDGVLLGSAADTSDVKTILDIGTGSGLIALMLAQRSDALITAIEPHYDSYIQCLENVTASKWKERINVINLKLQDYFSDTSFDLIVSNPPYFTDSLLNPDRLKASARHDNSLGKDELLEGVKRLLSEDGRFQVILPGNEGSLFISQAVTFGLYCNSVLKIRPFPDGEVIRMIISFTSREQDVKESFLTIENGGRHNYTEDYKNLTREFYLNF